MPEEQKVTRKLRAILSADVKGYSLLMADDEAFTIRTLKEYRSIMSTKIEQHNGRVVDAPGDNLLAEFASAVDAVQCAVDIQKILKEKNQDLPDDKKLEFRIGVNIGDIVQDEDRIYGSGVNVAARIEGLADAGGVCVSRNAYDHIKEKLNFGYEYLGDHEVKNIKDPVRVYKVLTDPEDAGKLIGEEPKRIRKKWVLPLVIVAAIIVTSFAWYFYQNTIKPDVELASVENMSFPLPDKPSIAVLPFDNMSEDPKQEYFSDGITEEIITALSKIPKLFVIARNSTFTYKGKPVKVQQVSEELGVQYVVEGSVRRAEDRVRITAQLIDALSGHHIWAEKFDRDIKDIFAVQDEITKKVITSLQVKLTEGEQAGVYAKGTDNLEAYLKAMKANWLYLQSTKEGVLKALELAEEAIALDPNYAFAYKVLGGAHGITLWLGISKNPRETLKLAIELHRKAIELDDSLAIAHSALGYWLIIARQHDKGLAEGEQAIALESSSADVINGYAMILRFVGKEKEAIPLFEEALRLNPKPPNVYLHNYAATLRDLGLYDEAIVQVKRAIEKKSNDLLANVVLTSCYSQAGREEEARTAAKEVLRLNPKFSVAQIQRTAPYKNRDNAKRFGDSLRKAGLPD